MDVPLSFQLMEKKDENRRPSQKLEKQLFDSILQEALVAEKGCNQLCRAF
jgi:hypothetical protein